MLCFQAFKSTGTEKTSTEHDKFKHTRPTWARPQRGKAGQAIDLRVIMSMSSTGVTPCDCGKTTILLTILGGIDCNEFVCVTRFDCVWHALTAAMVVKLTARMATKTYIGMHYFFGLCLCIRTVSMCAYNWSVYVYMYILGNVCVHI